MTIFFRLAGTSLFFVSFLLAVVSPCSGQSYLVRTYTETDGLASSQVYGLTQDRSGRMWFATRGGISVYDGIQWRTYSPSTGLPVMSCHNVLMDGDGVIWALGENPERMILRFASEKLEAFPLPIPIELSQVSAFVPLKGGEGPALALGIRRFGLWIFRNGAWTVIGSRQGLAGDTVNGIAALGDALYVATDRGLSIVSNGKVDNSLIKTIPRLSEGVAGIAVEEKKTGPVLWLAGNGWIGILSAGRLDELRSFPPVQIDTPYFFLHILPDGRGGVFVGNAFALRYCRAGESEAETLERKNGLVAPGATDMFMDRERNIWIAGLRGVSKVFGMRFANYNTLHGLLDDEVSAVAEAAPGLLVLGHNLGLTVYDGKTFRPLRLSPERAGSVEETRAMDFAVDARGVLWIAGSRRGLGRSADLKKITWSRPDGIDPLAGVNSVAIDRRGLVWASAVDSVYLVRGGVWKRISRVENAFIRRIVSAPDGSILAATTRNGICRIGPDGEYTAIVSDKGEENNVYSICLDSRGRMFAGTMGGLMEVRGGALTKASLSGRTIDRPVYLIFEDRRGRLWFGTDFGVLRWDGEGWREYTIKNGLSGQETNRAAGLCDSQGRIWIGTNMGLSLYLEEYDISGRDVPPPGLEITAVEEGGKRLSLDRTLSFAHDRNTLAFDFTGISLIDEDAVRFRSYLEGFDNGWGEEFRSYNRQVRYTNLPPGQYAFHVQARNALGVWGPAVVSPVVIIEKPYWKSSWFTAAAVAAGIFVYVGVFILVGRLRYAGRLKREVQERTAQIQASLMEKEVLLREIHHRVKNNLQIVSSLLYLQSRKAGDETTLDLFRESMAKIKAMALTHEALYKTENLAAIDAADYFGNLLKYLESTYGLSGKGIAITLQASNAELSMETAMACGLIVNELVTNAVKHAFPGGRGGRIRIGFATEASASGKEDGTCVLTVADDGVGLPDGLDIDKIQTLGLQLVRNLVQQMGGTLEIGRKGGTEFRIRFDK